MAAELGITEALREANSGAVERADRAKLLLRSICQKLRSDDAITCRTRGEVVLLARECFIELCGQEMSLRLTKNILDGCALPVLACGKDRAANDDTLEVEA